MIAETEKETDICGVERIIGRTTWICIKKVHSKAYERKNRYGIVFSGNSENHYFVNKRERWKNGQSENTTV